MEVNTIHVTAVLNENWRGKSDALERRRIQNRLNQRAFRQRQRSKEPPSSYPRPGDRRLGTESASPNDSNDDDDDGNGSEGSAQAPRGSSTTGPMWDELGRLINRNLHAAAVENAQLLGLDLHALRHATPVCTPQTTAQQTAPTSLQPEQAQYVMAHDPIIDTIPHARFRYNILRAIAQHRLDPIAFSADLRQSGALVDVDERGGLVVWDLPEQMASWEISERFARRWGFLLIGCGDFVAATNAWRGQRGQRLFPPSLAAET